MQEPVTRANAPERRRAHLVGRSLTSVLDDAIASADVMQCEVAEGMDYLVAKSRRNCECPAVNQCSGSCGLECARMTNRATHGVEQRVTTSGSRWDGVLPAGRTSRSHEVCKRQHVAAVIFRICNRVEWSAGAIDDAFSSAAGILKMSRVGVIRTSSTIAGEFVGDAHLVEISVTG